MRNASSNRQQDLYSSWFSSPLDGLELGPRFSVVLQDIVTYLTQDQSGFNTVSLLYYNKFRTVIRTLIGSSIVGCGISPYHILILTSKEEKRVPVNNGCAGRQGYEISLLKKMEYHIKAFLVEQGNCCWDSHSMVNFSTQQGLG